MIKLKKLKLEDISANDVRDEYTLYQSNAIDYRAQMAEDEEFYLGVQLTSAQKDYLLSVGQPPEANNKIRPAVEQVLANIAGASPEWDVHATGKTDNEVAHVYNALLDKVWYDSNGDRHYRSVCRDFIVKGIGFVYVYPDWQAENGAGGIRIKRVSPESVYVDPNSIDPFFRDASSIILSDLHTKESLKHHFPEYADIIEDAREDEYKNEIGADGYNRDKVLRRNDITSDGQPKVRKFVRWSYVNVPHVIVTDVLTGKYDTFDHEQYLKLSKEDKYKSYIKAGQVEEQVTYIRQVRELFVIGDKVIYDEVLPIDRFPLIPACNEHNGTPYPAGDVRHAKSPQRMLNRTEALLISHATSTASFKLIYEDGALDPEEMEKWFVPNAIIRANPNALSNGKIKEFAPPSISSQLYSEKQRYEIDIETIFGAYKFQQGDPRGAVGTVGEAQIIDEASSRKQNWKILPVYDMLNEVGKCVALYTPYVYDKQRVLRIVNPLGIEKELTINVPVINDYTKAVERIYDVTTAEVDIRVVVGSTRAKSPSANLSRDISLMQVGIYDKIQVIMNMEGDVDKTALIERMGEISNLTSENAQLKEQNKELSGDIQTRERELFHANMRAEIANATKPVAQAVSNLRATAKAEQDKQKEMTRETASDLAFMSDSAINSETEAPPPIEEGIMGVG
jgi:hypothetical protein